jgi:superfamily II DNA/RNA helicase
LISRTKANSAIRAALLRPAAKSRALRWRSYQVDAAWRAFGALSKGHSAVIELPTGTGKTIIANFVSLWMYGLNQETRGLYVVPRRVLVQQHREYARWLPPELHALELTSREANNGFEFDRRIKRARLVITTPGLLAGMIDRGLWSARLLKSVGYVVLDEFDEFLQFEYRESAGETRFDRALDNLLDLLGRRRPTLLLSGTSPLAAVRAGNSHPVVNALAHFIKRKYKPLEISPNEAKFKQHLPSAQISLQGISDSSVRALNEAIRNEKKWCFDTLSHDHQAAIDEDYAITRLEGLLSGWVKRLRFVCRGRKQLLNVTAKDFKLLGRVRLCLSLFDFVFEDLGDPLAVELRHTWHLVSRETMEERMDLRLRLEHVFTKSDIDGYRPKLRSKWIFIQSILASPPGPKGVIFLRYIRMADRIKAELEGSDWRVVQIDGECSDDERRNALRSFQSSKRVLLIITRATGKRGLDLPDASFAIFYSPKAEENTMWQELSRIRSTVERMKTSYLLYYSSTAEEEKALRLAEQMVNSGRRYRVAHKSSESASSHIMSPTTTSHHLAFRRSERREICHPVHARNRAGGKAGSNLNI